MTRNLVKRLLLLGPLLACLVLAPSVTSVFPGEIHVDPDSANHTISEGMLQAEPGDIVLVGPGTYEEEVRIVWGVTLRSVEGPESTRIQAPNGSVPSVRFDPAGGFCEADTITPPDTTYLVGFDVMQSHEFGVTTIIGDHEHVVVESCWIATPGPFENGNVAVLLRFGGIVRQSMVLNNNESSTFLSTQPFANMLVEDCVIQGMYPWGLSGFGGNSETIFKNNTIWGSVINTDVANGETGFSMEFVNNIFHHSCEIWCYYPDPRPDNLEFRYNNYWPFEPDGICAPQGEGNFVADPLICDDEFPDYDWRLDPASPCIGAGENGDDVGARLGICIDPTSVDQVSSLAPSLSKVWPNPTASRSTVSLRVPLQRRSEVEILDLRGRVVRAFHVDAGQSRIDWDGLDQNGSRVPSGVYFLRIDDGSSDQVRRITLVR